ncbi:MAG: hypothetical protein DMG65_03010 [Candidatus Angelobacter sp. Gp1-AA117]|nr:MAG: hypothetical protein DMG65_03010 [Candidatus Angelobacter sp. Gp1-AA117]
MWMDIAIAVGLALITALMGYLGVHVTLHPQSDPKQISRFKYGFAFCVAAAIGLIAWQTVRSTNQQRENSALLARIERNTEHPPNVNIENKIDTKPLADIFRPEKIAQIRQRPRVVTGDSASSESSEVGIYPVSHDLRPGMPKMEYVMTTRKMRSPVQVTATCDFPISEASATFLVPLGMGGSAGMFNNQRISERQFRILILSPVWSESAPMWVTVFFEGKVDRMPFCQFQIG